MFKQPVYTKTQISLAKLISWIERLQEAIASYRLNTAFAKAVAEPAPEFPNLTVVVITTEGTVMSTDNYSNVNPIHISQRIFQSLRPYRKEAA